MVVRQRAHLPLGGGHEARLGEAERRAPQPGHGLDVVAAVFVDHAHAGVRELDAEHGATGGGAAGVIDGERGDDRGQQAQRLRAIAFAPVGRVADAQAHLRNGLAMGANRAIHVVTAPGEAVLIDEAGDDKARWNVMEAWPTKYDAGDLSAKGSDVVIETLDLVCEEVVRVQ